jgi:hypothetical protein
LGAIWLQVVNHLTLCNVSLNSINKQLSKFWDVDEYPTNKRVVIVKKEDIECETHFKNTCSRNAEGRFTVEIPFKLNGPNIGVSKEMAIKRFLSLENKFRKDPADIISRGVYPPELLTNNLWFTGPHWLSQNPDGWPSQTAQQITGEVPELRQVVTLTVIGTDDSHPNLSVINQFSTFRKLRRIIALCLRFADLCKKRITKNGYNHPSTAELQNAEEKIILLVQKANFEHEIRDLKAGRQVNSKSKLKLLNPFIDNSGMIRVGGRLSNSQYPHDKKYPIVLPKGHVTRLILENTHRDQLHAGPTATLAAVREKFWPLDGRSEIRKVVHRCIPCFRSKPHDNNPIAGRSLTVALILAVPYS